MKKMNGIPISLTSDGEPGFSRLGSTADINRACDRRLRELGAVSDGELAFKARVAAARRKRRAKS